MGLFFTLWGLALAAHALAPPRGGVARLQDLLTQRAVQTQAAHFARARRCPRHGDYMASVLSFPSARAEFTYPD